MTRRPRDRYVACAACESAVRLAIRNQIRLDPAAPCALPFPAEEVSGLFGIDVPARKTVDLTRCDVWYVSCSEVALGLRWGTCAWEMRGEW